MARSARSTKPSRFGVCAPEATQSVGIYSGKLKPNPHAEALAAPSTSIGPSLESLTDTITLLVDDIEELWVRLDPVMTPEPIEGGRPGEQAVCRSLSPIASQIQMQADVLGDLHRKFQALIRRLDV